jgi:peptidyl-prolyl cis-trans isomerase B (cyclophilin B)
MVTNKKILLINLVLAIFLGSLLLTGCNSSPTSVSSSSDTLSDAQVKPVSTNTSNKEMFDNLPRLEGIAKVEFTVKGSPIVLEVNGNDAPITAGNFVDLVQKGVYDGLVFHRVIKSPQPFVAQGGDPQGKDPNFPVSRLGTGGYTDESGIKRFIPLEIKLEGESEPTYSKGLGQQSGIASPKVTLKHNRGALAMARSAPPDSASSQFYIALADLDFLDGDYAVFGKVLTGMDVVDEINQGDRIDSAKVIEGAENLQ